MVAIVAMVLGKEYVKVSRVPLETGMVSFLGLGLTAQDRLVCMYLVSNSPSGLGSNDSLVLRRSRQLRLRIIPCSVSTL